MTNAGPPPVFSEPEGPALGPGPFSPDDAHGLPDLGCSTEGFGLLVSEAWGGQELFAEEGDPLFALLPAMTMMTAAGAGGPVLVRSGGQALRWGGVGCWRSVVRMRGRRRGQRRGRCQVWAD